ncbi:MAG TPA: YCF48-related protein, partial [Pyrinomonadaceae bacterium]|nr:YCF48-related protein [Pyrinomonadaceae bacterium]
MISHQTFFGRAARRVCAALLLALATGAASGARAQDAGWVGERRGQAGKDLNAVYFADSKRGWVAGDGGLVLHTQDGGRTWAAQRVETGESVNDIYFRDKEDGYLLAGDRIFTTEDGGATWRMSNRFQSATFGGADPELYSVRFTSKKRGWIVGSLSRRDRVTDSLVLHTGDGGTSWQRLRVPVQDELIHLDFDSDKRGWIVGAAGRILHTRDGGETWALQTSNTKAVLYHVDFNGDDRGWAVGERGTILRTRDGGATWEAVGSPARSTLLSVKFANDDDGWIVGRGGVSLRSEDGGQTWVEQESRTRQNLYALYLDKKTGWAVGGD